MKKVLSIILTVAMLFTMAIPVFADGIDGPKREPMANGTITVAVSADFAPFEYYEGDELTGFDIELMKCICERIGYDAEFVVLPFDELIPAVKSGEADCAISAISITKERDSVIDYTTPYLTANVTYKNDVDPEDYAVVFPNGAADAIYRSSMPTESETVYLMVNSAIEDLKKDGTVEKLIEKYDLNKPFDEDAEYNFEYFVAGDSEFITEDEKIAVPAPSEWAEEDIDFAYRIGITDSNKEYLYKDEISREEFCELIYNLITLVKGEITAPMADGFTDTKNDKILVLNGLGIVDGKSETEFAPDDSLTREEAATIIVRMVNKVMPMAATEIWFEYDDADEISEWASDSVQTISNMGFMTGVGANKFAPKDTYTTEQAIITLVRVYDGAEAAGIIDHDSSIGIIGGADGPTSIFVGGDVTVLEDEEYDNFCAEVNKNTVKVDDFYIDKAIKLVSESGLLAADAELISYYTDDMKDKFSKIGSADYSKPSEIYYLAADKEQIIASLKAQVGENEDDIKIAEKLLESKRFNFTQLAAMINAAYGAENLAAISILTNSEGYIMPKDFKKDFALYLKYEGGYSAFVSFSKYGEGVISANMMFVINGDNDNIFSCVYELTKVLGKESVEFAKVVK